jgi:hypothetical protein
MSPVSRGRKPKKSKKSKKSKTGRKPPVRTISSGWAKTARPAPGDPGPGVPGSPVGLILGALGDEHTQWWKPSHDRLIAASGALLAAPGPRALEQATAELMGAELYDAVLEERTGLRFDVWAMELAERAAQRIVETAREGGDAWRGPWWLLHGLAAIGSYGLGGFAREQASLAAKSLPRDLRSAEPAWLNLLPDIKATDDVWVMRDAYGTRFGVIAGFRYPGGIDPSVYLLDIDASGLVRLAGAGVFDDVEEAATAWRDHVGVSAEGLIPAAATPESLTCLVYYEHEEQHVVGDESRMVMDNWFRAPRRIRDIGEALRERGIVLPDYSPRYDGIDVTPMADPFATWYAERHGHEPGREAVEALAEEWLEGMLPGTEHSVSPHRSEYFRELIGDWLDDPVTDAVRALLPEWVRWNGEQAGVPAPLIEYAVSAASDGQAATAPPAPPAPSESLRKA